MRPVEPLRLPRVEEAGHRRGDGDVPRRRLAVDFGDAHGCRLAVGWVAIAEPTPSRTADAASSLSGHELQQREGYHPWGPRGQASLCEGHVLGELHRLPLPTSPGHPGCCQAPVRWPAEAHLLTSTMQRPTQGEVHIVPVRSGVRANVLDISDAPAPLVCAEQLGLAPPAPAWPAAPSHWRHGGPGLGRAGQCQLRTRCLDWARPVVAGKRGRPGLAGAGGLTPPP